jgi:hypothetical protein
MRPCRTGIIPIFIIRIDAELNRCRSRQWKFKTKSHLKITEMIEEINKNSKNFLSLAIVIGMPGIQALAFHSMKP